MSETIEYQAGSALVDDGIEFTINGFFGRKKTVIIKPLRPGTIVRIGMEIKKMQKINEEENMIRELLAKGQNINQIAACISHAIINRQFFKLWKFWYYRWILLERSDNLKELNSYMNIVYRQMDSSQFFFIMALTPAMDLLMKKTTTTDQK